MKKRFIAILIAFLVLVFFLTLPVHQLRNLTATTGQQMVLVIPDGARATGALPAGMERAGASLRWSPMASQQGVHTLTFAWGFPRESQLTFRIDVLAAAPEIAPNLATPNQRAAVTEAATPKRSVFPQRRTLPEGATVSPQFVNVPSLRVKAGELWTYQPQADVMEGRFPRFSLHKSPPGMKLDEETKTLLWTPPPDFIGEAVVSMMVWDKHQGYEHLDFVLSTESIFKINAFGDWPQTLQALPNGVMLGISQARLMLTPGDMREVLDSYWLPTRSARTFLYYKGFVYLGTELTGLHVLDVRDGKRIVPCARLSTGWRASKYNAISDDILVVAGSDYSLYFYSLEDPANPVQLSRLYMGVNKNTYSVRSVGRTAYVQGHKYVAAVDFSDPSRPFLLSELEISTAGSSGAFMVVPPYLYQFGSERVIVDATDPKKLTLVKASKEKDPWLSLGVVLDKHVLLYGDEGVSRLDLSDPVAPHSIEAFSSRGLQLGAGPDGLYQTTSEGKIVSIKSRGDLEKNRNPRGQSYAAVASSPSTVYAVGTTLDILDVSKPASPRLLSRTPLHETASEMKAVWVNNILFTSAGIFDVRDRAQPRKIQSMTGIRNFAVDGTMAYSVSGNEITQWTTGEGLVAREAKWKLDAPVECLAAKGERLYVGVKPCRLKTYKITPEKLELLDDKIATRYEKDGVINDMKIDGEHLYCALNSMGITCNSIKNPDKPEWFSYALTDQYATCLEVRNGFVFVATGSGGVQIVEKAQAGKVKVLCSYATSDWTSSVTIVDEVLVTAERNAGVQFFASEMLSGKNTWEKYKLQLEPAPVKLPKTSKTAEPDDF